MYLCRLKTLGKGQRRQNGGQTLGHHTLAGAGRTYHDDVVATGSGYLQGPLHILLSADIREVKIKIVLLLVELLAGVNYTWRELLLPGEKGNDIGEVVDAIDIEFVDDGCLALILLGHYQSFEMLSPGLDSYGEHALGWL